MTIILLCVALISAVCGQYTDSPPRVQFSEGSSFLYTQSLPNKEANNNFQGYLYQKGSEKSFEQVFNLMTDTQQSGKSSNIHNEETKQGSQKTNVGFSTDIESSHGGGQTLLYSGNENKEKAIIKKHYYVHVAPEEPEVNIKTRFVETPPEKHYKIIFVKVPSYQPKRPEVLTLPQRQEEKTIIYVLVKEPKTLEEIPIPQPKPTEPSKPEVYFVKYKSQKKINNLNGIHDASLIGNGQIDEDNINEELIAAGGLPSSGIDQQDFTSGSSFSTKTRSGLKSQGIFDAQDSDQQDFGTSSFGDNAADGVKSFSSGSRVKLGNNGRQRISSSLFDDTQHIPVSSFSSDAQDDVEEDYSTGSFGNSGQSDDQGSFGRINVLSHSQKAIPSGSSLGNTANSAIKTSSNTRKVGRPTNYPKHS